MTAISQWWASNWQTILDNGVYESIRELMRGVFWVAVTLIIQRFVSDKIPKQANSLELVSAPSKEAQRVYNAERTIRQFLGAIGAMVVNIFVFASLIYNQTISWQIFGWFALSLTLIISSVVFVEPKPQWMLAKIENDLKTLSSNQIKMVKAAAFSVLGLAAFGILLAFIYASFQH